MTILRVPKDLYDQAVTNDPDAVAVASQEFWGDDDSSLHLGRPGQHGATYDDNGNELTPATHYVWGDRRVLDLEAVVEFSLALAAAADGDPQPAPADIEDADEARARRVAARRRARKAARMEARAEEREARIEQRKAERQKTRKEIRTEARRLYRVDARRAARADKDDVWVDWDDADEEVEALYLLAAANRLGHADVNVVAAAEV